MQFIDLPAQYQQLKDKIDHRIQAVLDHGMYIMGPEVFELEKQLAEYVGVKHAITCANGTDALQLAMMSMNIGPGDAVFCPSFTFFATAEVIALAGATPVFIDSNLGTFNMCSVDLKRQIENIVTSHKELTPKAIICVDLFGLPADYPEVERIASEYNLVLIEDAAQGFGGEINGRRAGSFGHIATTSFFPAKPLGCYGDGGALFTSDDEIADLLRSLRVHGKGIDKYDNIRIGLNSRLDTIQAAVLLEKLAAFPNEVVKRNEIARRYAELLDVRFITPAIPEGYLSSWAQYTIRPPQDNSRDIYKEALAAKGIPSVVYYGKSLHKQTALKDICKNTSLSGCDALETQVFSLPMHPYLSVDDQMIITRTLNEAML